MSSSNFDGCNACECRPRWAGESQVSRAGPAAPAAVLRLITPAGRVWIGLPARIFGRPDLADQTLQIGEKGRVGLFRAFGVFDDDPGHPEADQSQAHGHTVVVIGGNASAV